MYLAVFNKIPRSIIHLQLTAKSSIAEIDIVVSLSADCAIIVQGFDIHLINRYYSYLMNNENNDNLELKSSTIRATSAAGEFYPKNPAELSGMLARFFSETEKKFLPGKIATLIVPQAAYLYSGQTAAAGFKALQGETYDTVVILSSSNNLFFKGSSIYDGDSYETPLGIVEIDKELAEKLSDIHPLVYKSNVGHATGKTRGEHGIEIQLPFLQMIFGKFKMVPIVMGDQEEDSISSLGNVLSSLSDYNILTVVSTSLSQFHSETEIRKMDSLLMSSLEKSDPSELLSHIDSGKIDSAGGAVLAAALIASKLDLTNKFQKIEYTTSAESTGNFDDVVGYLTAAFVSEKDFSKIKNKIGSVVLSKEEEKKLTEEDKEYLKAQAKEAIIAKLDNKDFSPTEKASLLGKRSLFVTIRVDGKEKGEMGRLRTDLPLYQSVCEMATAAAFDDPRVEALTSEEKDMFELEISILSNLKRERNFSRLKIGINGVMIKLDMNSALILPQIAERNNWGPIELLENCCLKAGLPKNGYKDKLAEVFTFTTEVF